MASEGCCGVMWPCGVVGALSGRTDQLISGYVMAQSVIWTDDTPIRTLAPGTGKTRLSRFWCYAVDPRPYQGPGCPAVLYRYSPDRKRQRYRSCAGVIWRAGARRSLALVTC